MVASTRAIGLLERSMATALSAILTVNSTKDSSRTTTDMGKANSSMLTPLDQGSIKETGHMTRDMDKVKKNTQMVTDMKAASSMTSQMAKAA